MPIAAEVHTPITGEELAHTFEEQTPDRPRRTTPSRTGSTLAIFWLMALAVFLQFFTRYVLNNSFAWTEEIATYCLVADRVPRRGHVRARSTGTSRSTSSTATCRPASRACSSTAVDVVRIAVLRLRGAVSSGRFMRRSSATRRMTTIDLPKNLVYGAVFVGFVLMFVRSVQVSIENWRRGYSSWSAPKRSTPLSTDASLKRQSLMLILLGSFLAPDDRSACRSPLPWPSRRCSTSWSTGNAPDVVLAHRMIAGVESFPLLAVPFFILAGNLMNIAGVTSRIYNFAVALVGWMKGGLGHVNIIGSVIFAGMSGTAIADAAGLGTIEIKAMKDHGYSTEFAVGVTAASATLGPIIPPSLPFVIYGMMANVSIGALFLAGIIPGVVMTRPDDAHGRLLRAQERLGRRRPVLLAAARRSDDRGRDRAGLPARGLAADAGRPVAQPRDRRSRSRCCSRSTGTSTSRP